MSSSQSTVGIVRPIIEWAYGGGSFPQALATNLAEKIDAQNWDSRGREYMIMRTCWDWMPGGTTAERVAKKIEEALP